ncbi:bifunctional DNA-formamidopyrimidine glycosylase/DNA-(apurinic or apyrimidinic site) lyase [Stappia sp. GBMRC 2046]|uniref:Formamidopyrimidine-DNA glycosylase n=1 Tax=Stappia sediminis TaxID=2692190 RepID=A0A7X3LXA8_9HYPH|nr:bifunctional DNA-formamidopyrimidine glycosylase/DNA-(apurinic or apyrimidinic site) lyase [Stappia sediminis]MXN66788.1 bifunctional DNA-formamidopyrimidine glycosylase/DNA-(apurinic or apyrimidinic site) lyase [Stappia sediminis]
MPELPEVETVRRGLAPSFEDARILRVEQRRPDLRFPFPERFADRLTGRRVTGLGRRSKYLMADLDDGSVLVMHLGMSGSFRVEAGQSEAGQSEAGEAEAPGEFHHPRSKDQRHDHVVFHLEGAARPGAVRIVYNDPRRFGFMTLVERAGLASHPLFEKLGIEPTGNQLDADLLARLFNGRKTPLKAALLDQRLIAGLGNIYVCEALHRAGLSPKRAAGTIVTKAGKGTVAAERLARSIREVIAEAIAAGGSSLRDHRQADGTLGYFQHSFLVYDREGASCPREGCGGTVLREVQGGRSSFFCARCQK